MQLTPELIKAVEMAFGGDVRKFFYMLRKAKKITLDELQKAINIDKSMISRYENNQCDLKPEKEKAYREYILNKKVRYE